MTLTFVTSFAMTRAPTPVPRARVASLAIVPTTTVVIIAKRTSVTVAMMPAPLRALEALMSGLAIVR